MVNRVPLFKVREEETASERSFHWREKPRLETNMTTAKWEKSVLSTAKTTGIVFLAADKRPRRI